MDSGLEIFKSGIEERGQSTPGETSIAEMLSAIGEYNFSVAVSSDL